MKKIFTLAIGTLALGSCFGFGFFWRDIQKGGGRAGNFSLGVKTTPTGMAPDQIFKQNFLRISSQYRGKIDSKDLKYAAMEGLVSSMGDPHSNFFVPQVAKAFSDDTRGNFFGVGAKLGYDALGAKVATVFTTGPAFKAGLKEGDVITSVDGVSMVGKSTDFIVTKVKGEEGTTVTLGLIRAGQEKPIVITVKRARIIAPSVESKSFEGGKVGYLQVYQFSEPTAEQFETELSKLEAGGMEGLVIDLRGNPGGLLETASDMLSRFFDDKTVVTMRFREESQGGMLGRNSEEQKTQSGMVKGGQYPITILMNEDSASASEIFAGVMQDYGRAKIVGEHSYGKASVQNVFPLRDGASVKLTIAKYYLPKGRFIGRTVDEDGSRLAGGLLPDFPVELDPTKEITFGDPKTDSQLAKAIELVKKG